MWLFLLLQLATPSVPFLIDPIEGIIPESKPTDTILSIVQGGSWHSHTLVDIKATGDVIVYGKPEKAARLFWRTVSHTRRNLCRGLKR